MSKLFTTYSLLLGITFTSYNVYANEYSIIKPIWGKHYTERNFNGKDWNENYLDSIGVGYRHDSGLGAHIIYANENSVNNQSLYIHGEYMYEVNDWFSVGSALGIRNGYPKKALGRTENDFIASGAGQLEACYDSYCSLLMVAPNVSIINLKYRFE